MSEIRFVDNISNISKKLSSIPDVSKYLKNLDPNIIVKLQQNIDKYPLLYENLGNVDELVKRSNILSKFDDLNLTYLDDLNLEQLYKLDEFLQESIRFRFDDLKNFKNVDELYKEIPEIKNIGKNLGTFSKTETPIKKGQTVNEFSSLTGAERKKVMNGIDSPNKLSQGNPEETSKFIDSFKKGAIKTKDDVVKWVKANKVSATMLTLVTTLAVIATIRTQSINSKQYVITSIIQNGDYIDIRYNDTIKFASGTSVNILSSNCLPSINGDYKMSKTQSGKFSIKGPKITSNGTYGTFTCVTTFGDELGDSVNKYIKEPTSEFSSGFLKQLVNYESIADFFSKNWWILLLFFIFLFLSSVLSVFIRK